MFISYFKINEIAKLYNISTDTLRFYEKIGLIKPSRFENGYRCYSVKEIWKINIIADLRKLHVPIKDIQNYFQNRNVDSTRLLFSKQIEEINKQIKNLNKIKASMSASLRIINEFSSIPDTSIFLKRFERRSCIKPDNSNLSTLGIDIGFRVIQLKSNEMFTLVGNNNFCVSISIEKIIQDGFKDLKSVVNYDIEDSKTIIKENLDFYESVFYIVDDNEIVPDFFLEAGTYACISYKGPHVLSKEHTKQLLMYAKNNNLKFLGKPFELCIIDIHETIDPNEFITQIQVRVE